MVFKPVACFTAMAATDSLTMSNSLAHIRRLFIVPEALKKDDERFRRGAGADVCVLYQVAILQGLNDPSGIVKGERCASDDADCQVEIQ